MTVHVRSDTDFFPYGLDCLQMRLRTTRRTSSRRGSASGALGVLAALALVSTASAPGAIRIRPGDTLSALADRWSTTVAALRGANHLSGDRIYAGGTLHLPQGGTAPSSATERTHVVRAGETVPAIALQYGASTAAVVRRNGLSGGARILPGQQLVVPVPAGSAAATSPATAASASAAAHRSALLGRAVPSRDTVRRTVASTARRYGVDVSLALAVAYQESGFQQRVVSPVDAIGVMQVLPSTGRALSAQTGRQLDLLDAGDNITAGVLLLRQLVSGTGSERAAVRGYYQGLGSIAEQGVLPQTHAYLRSVQALRPQFRNG